MFSEHCSHTLGLNRMLLALIKWARSFGINARWHKTLFIEFFNLSFQKQWLNNLSILCNSIYNESMFDKTCVKYLLFVQIKWSKCCVTKSYPLPILDKHIQRCNSGESLAIRVIWCQLISVGHAQESYKAWPKTSRKAQWQRQSWFQDKVHRFPQSQRWSPARSSWELARTLGE